MDVDNCCTCSVLYIYILRGEIVNVQICMIEEQQISMDQPANPKADMYRLAASAYKDK
jgi:hypothetical protein